MAKFVYVGDRSEAVKHDHSGRIIRPAENQYVDFMGYSFELNGEPVEVTDENAIRKLMNNSHFVEYKGPAKGEKEFGEHGKEKEVVKESKHGHSDKGSSKKSGSSEDGSLGQ